MVGVKGFEPSTSASRTQRSTKLSHTPTKKFIKAKDGVKMKKLLYHYSPSTPSCQRFYIKLGKFICRNAS